jgi:hypothetical protein
MESNEGKRIMQITGKLIILVFAFLILAASAYADYDSRMTEATEKGDKAEVEALLAKGANVNDSDVHGNTPLHKAAYRGRQDIAELLLDKGADVNAKDKNGATPLHRAAYYGKQNIAKLLLANGAEASAMLPDGKTPLDIAILSGKKELVELLKEHLARQARLLESHIKNNPHAAFLELTARLKGNPAEDSTRRLIIKLATELKPAPAIPEEARKYFVEGTAIVKAAKNPAQQTLAALSFTEALKIAPWWGDAYYNLGVAQELAEKYDEAEQAFNFYLLSNPSEAEKREVQDRIYGLSAKRKLAGVK